MMFSLVTKKGIIFLSSIRTKYLPNIILGDFDSIKDDIKKYYEDKGVKFLHNKDQDTTDLEKAIFYVFENSETLA